jgi:hypothetical protein
MAHLRAENNILPKQECIKSSGGIPEFTYSNKNSYKHAAKNALPAN